MVTLLVLLIVALMLIFMVTGNLDSRTLMVIFMVTLRVISMYTLKRKELAESAARIRGVQEELLASRREELNTETQMGRPIVVS